MCGIAGSFSSQSLNKVIVEKAISAISHRGPDETGFFHDEYCSLGMCRLAIIDVSTGQQPSFSYEKDVISVFNGEIYNFKEIREQLLSRGHVIPTPGDSALIPFLYKEFGESFPKYIQGMFAIAIYDKRQKKLLLTRDRLGKKPLWYACQGNQVSFSSELKGLLELGIRADFDESNLGEFLTFGYINAPRSPYKRIKHLPPATVLVFHEGKERTEIYWDSSDVQSLRISFEEAKEETKRLLEVATESRLISERPVGAFLSGGIDSTIVSSIMSKLSNDRIHTYSIGFNDRKFDESLHAAKVAKYLGTIHHEKILEADPNFVVSKLAKTLDQPFADSSVIPTFLLSQFARESVVVALSGDGGDEAFAGYERYRAGKVLDDINPLLSINPLTLYPSQRLTNLRLRKLLKHSRAQSLEKRYRGFQSLFQPNDLKRVLNSDLFELATKDHFSNLWEDISSKDKIRKMQEVDIKSYLPGDLMYKVDIASMANSLEVRSPFLDYRVVEFGLSLPWKYKVGGGENKHILREIARELVPKHLIDRPKMGFGIPRSRWLRQELRHTVSEVLLDKDSQSRGWFNQNEVRKILSLHQNGQELDHLLWPMFTLQLWAKNWLD
jgi:asparagine synthase (glutamine-hydrolysing)